MFTMFLKTSDLLDKYANRLEERDFYASKSDYGKLLIIGGSFGMSGAAYLSGLAAFRSGIGMVRYLGPECNRVILQSLLPEAMYDSVSDQKSFEKALGWADYVICGPGLGQSMETEKFLKLLFQADLSEKKLVLLDADALNIVSSGKFSIKELSLERSRKGRESNIVITPHVGEMSRLCKKSIAEIKETPSETALAYAREQNCTVVLKDAVSFVALPGGRVYENNSGHAAMAKAGSGDVLTGVIAGVTAITGGGAQDGAVLGDFVHGKAGELAALYRGEHSILARDIADAVSGVIGKISVKYDDIFNRVDALYEQAPGEKE